jgi:hypothetical protein
MHSQPAKDGKKIDIYWFSHLNQELNDFNDLWQGRYGQLLDKDSGP